MEKKRKQELDQESDEENKKTRKKTLSCSSSCFLVFFYKFPPLDGGNRIEGRNEYLKMACALSVQGWEFIKENKKVRKQE